MSFGLLKHFKESRTGNLQGSLIRHFSHIILGQDLGAVLKLLELRLKYPGEQIKLISERLLTRQMLNENYSFGISQLRSAEAVEQIYRKYHDCRILPQRSDASFYKDGKFHDFGGRAKPMEMRAGEEFFSAKGYRLELSSLFSAEEWENLDSILSEHSEIRIFEAVEKTEATDLVDKAEWKISFKDFSSVTAENLYVSMSPKKFLNLFHDKALLTSEMVDACSAVQVQAAISLTWELDKEIFAEDKTLFIPQSMTHEWGHFIVEFEPFNYQTKTQLCHVLFLIHEEEPQSEELASKIKLMKRVLDRVFNDIEKHIKKEYIRYDEEMFISDIKDTALEQLAFDYSTLHFAGQSSPMKDGLCSEKYLSRVLLN